ncbi:hypothetical protein DEU34_0296 [Microbacterium sp. AG1240]|uniref:hypothetical protein n=1 Tax=Microbacterium sp. AG1240 TaxID=2183992 RepID=UPI000EB11369|nr:hypothetical protein [Microbacterium sp. AG1240]RKT35791.1 hypothetical protein DEU34_0296 [Microbacterium sp. AG1240]
MDAPPLDSDRQSPSPVAAHEHGWATESAHRTSEGRLLYVRCLGCGARRVDLQPGPRVPPVAVSVPTAPDSAREFLQVTVSALEIEEG